jgi:hypothetical protein
MSEFEPYKTAAVSQLLQGRPFLFETADADFRTRTWRTKLSTAQSLVTFLRAPGLSYSKPTDGIFAYLDSARLPPRGTRGSADYACDAGR